MYPCLSENSVKYANFTCFENTENQNQREKNLPAVNRSPNAIGEKKAD